jgi:hypothetical protein
MSYVGRQAPRISEESFAAPSDPFRLQKESLRPPRFSLVSPSQGSVGGSVRRDRVGDLSVGLRERVLERLVVARVDSLVDPLVRLEKGVLDPVGPLIVDYCRDADDPGGRYSSRSTPSSFSWCFPAGGASNRASGGYWGSQPIRGDDRPLEPHCPLRRVCAGGRYWSRSAREEWRVRPSPRAIAVSSARCSPASTQSRCARVTAV